MMIEVNNLIVTQDNIRNIDRVKNMIEYLKVGGIFTMESLPNFHQDESQFDLIKLSRFPCGTTIVQDGHHRLVSMVLSGRTHLDAHEYELKEYDDIKRYNEINLDVGWVTPFDVHTEIRISNLTKYKSKVFSLDKNDAISYIKNNKHEYAANRNGVRTVQELAEKVKIDLD